jgi:hypothetical protein
MLFTKCFNRREKNRVAARKCRAKKMALLGELQATVDELTGK